MPTFHPEVILDAGVVGCEVHDAWKALWMGPAEESTAENLDDMDVLRRTSAVSIVSEAVH